MRECIKCHEIKDLSDFREIKKGSNKYRTDCKLCEQEYYKSNKEHILKIGRIYRENHKEVIKILQAKNYQETKLKRRWILHYRHAKERCNNPNHHCYPRYGGRGIKFLLTLEETKELWYRDKGWNLKNPSIDRIDNDGHYEFSNCRFIEMIDNCIKGAKEKKQKFKPILQLDLQGNLIKEWDRMRTISKELGFSPSEIYKVLKGNKLNAYGFIWQYLKK